MMIQSKRLFSLMLLSLVANLGHAEVYQWVDADDKIHYSDRKPDTETVVETLTLTTVAPPAERQTWQDQNEAFAERQKDAEKDSTHEAETIADAASKLHYCKQTNARITSLLRPRINTVNADGTRTRMSEEWRQSELAKARAGLAENCP